MTADVAVVGAGSFGAWTAWHLHNAGLRVLLVDAYGPANSRASSGGESRIIRMGYGAREVYTRWSIESMASWLELDATADQQLFVPCGALWIAEAGTAHARETLATFEACRVTAESLDTAELRRRYPHFQFSEGEWAIFEPAAGALMARRAIQYLVRTLIARGLRYEQRQIRDVSDLDAKRIVFACGPWLPKIFPDLLSLRILPSRQEVLFFGPPAGDMAYSASATPCWIDIATAYYGFPDLAGRGFKVALDQRGPRFDPDTEDRTVAPEAVDRAREYLSVRVPALASAPLVEARVCQYENTATSDYILDRHPHLNHVWIAGGGSGHGFKHGPAVGRYMKELVLEERQPEEPFRLASKPEFSELTTQSSL